MRKFLRHVRKSTKRLLRPVLRHFYLIEHVFPDEEARRNSDVRNVRVLVPGQRVEFASPEDDPFVSVGKYFREGWFDRLDVFVCEVPEAYLYVETGMVCTRNWKVLADLEYRLPYFNRFEERRPTNVKRLSGIYATASYCLAWNFYHWMVDCLPRMVSLARAEPTRQITLIVSDELGAVQRESLAAILPPNFTLEYHPANTWLQLETLLWPSLASSRCNAFLPADYFEAIRGPIFAKFQLPAVHDKKERIYITRGKGSRRHILNENALVAFLARYGFKTVDLEKMTFREQVELFHGAEIVVGPHGAGFNLLFFCGKISVVVLHPNQTPQNHFHTMVRGLGQNYHFVLHPGEDAEANFDADIPALKRVFDEELKLQPLP